MDPKTEWVNLLHGEDVQIHPADDDLAHMTRHMQDLQRAERQQGSSEMRKRQSGWCSTITITSCSCSRSGSTRR